MIDAHTMIQKMGKKAFVDLAIRSQPKETGAYLRDQKEKKSRRIRFSRCEHGVWVIEEYEPKPCEKCDQMPVDTGGCQFDPYFNAGIGGWVESRSDEKRAARQLGLREAG